MDRHPPHVEESQGCREILGLDRQKAVGYCDRPLANDPVSRVASGKPRAIASWVVQRRHDLSRGGSKEQHESQPAGKAPTTHPPQRIVPDRQELVAATLQKKQLRGPTCSAV